MPGTPDLPTLRERFEARARYHEDLAARWRALGRLLLGLDGALPECETVADGPGAAGARERPTDLVGRPGAPFVRHGSVRPFPEVPMHQHGGDDLTSYPHGRGYGHDYMRGGEVMGGYGYAERPDFERRRGEARADQPDRTPPDDGADAPDALGAP